MILILILILILIQILILILILCCISSAHSFLFRQFGGIPALLNQVRNPNSRVQLAVLGALRNLSYGRANNESKIQIAHETGLPHIVYLLRNSSQPEVWRRGKRRGREEGLSLFK